MNRIAVTGATGYAGRFVVAELLRQGVQVRALSRVTSNRAGFGDVVEWVTGDLRTSEALSRLVQGADAVIHLAYEHVPGRYRGGEGDDLGGWMAANVDGSLQLLRMAHDAQVGRFIFLSSRAVFSRTEPGRVLDESHPVSPDTHYGAAKVAVEAFLQSFAHAEGMQTCAIRATGIYGMTWPVQRSKWWDVVQAVLHDEPVTVTHGGTEVHGADVARVIWQVLAHPLETPADVIHMSDLYVTRRELVRLVREISGRPGPLPAEPAISPTNMLVCRRLQEMGMALGGRPLLQATVAEMVAIARKKAANP